MANSRATGLLLLGPVVLASPTHFRDFRLSVAYNVAITSAAGLRPGWMGVDEVASPHVLAYHDLSRLMELLLLWRSDAPSNRDIPYADIAYLAQQIDETPRNGAAV